MFEDWKRRALGLLDTNKMLEKMLKDMTAERDGLGAILRATQSQVTRLLDERDNLYEQLDRAGPSAKLTHTFTKPPITCPTCGKTSREHDLAACESIKRGNSCDICGSRIEDLGYCSNGKCDGPSPDYEHTDLRGMI